MISAEARPWSLDVPVRQEYLVFGSPQILEPEIEEAGIKPPRVAVNARDTPGNYPKLYNVSTGKPDELFAYGGYVSEEGGAYVAKLDARSLTEIWRAEIRLPDHWNYPGAMAVLDDGNAYAWIAIARLDPPVVALPAVAPAVRAEKLRNAAQLAAEPHEERLERERHRELELLGLAPGGPDDLAGALRILEPLDPLVHDVDSARQCTYVGW